MEVDQRKQLTVQGIGCPVPAAERGEQAGPPSSKTSDRNATAVEILAAGADNATRKDMTRNVAKGAIGVKSGINPLMTPNPFCKGSRMQRSPTEGQRPKSASLVDLRSIQTSAHLNFEAVCGDGAEPQNPKMRALRSNIETLQEFVKDKHNVHHEIKRLIRVIKSSYNDLEEEYVENKAREDPAKKSTNSVFATPPIIKQNALTKADAVQSKRRRENSNETPVTSLLNKKIKSNKTKLENDIGESRQGLENRKEAQIPNKDGWKTVKKKERKPKKPKKKAIRLPKPEAILVEKRGETTFAEILKKLKCDPNLKELGESVFKIRRTQKGDMLFELNKNNATESSKYKEQMAIALGDHANVKALKKEKVIVIKYLDEITTKEEIAEALSLQLANFECNETMVKWLSKGYGGTQNAGISLPADQAYKLLAVEKIKIGWSICRIKEIIQPKRCFKCMEFNHNSNDCKGVDRSKKCRKCGEEGHYVKVCTNTLKCMLCAGIADHNHIYGSTRCPVYRRAMADIRK